MAGLSYHSYSINWANLYYITYSKIKFANLFFLSISGKKGPYLHKTLPFESFLSKQTSCLI